MRNWRLDVSDDKADILLYLFSLLREHEESFLNADFIGPVTRSDFIDLMNWFEKAHDLRKARKAVSDKWGT